MYTFMIYFRYVQTCVEKLKQKIKITIKKKYIMHIYTIYIILYDQYIMYYSENLMHSFENMYLKKIAVVGTRLLTFSV